MFSRSKLRRPLPTLTLGGLCLLGARCAVPPPAPDGAAADLSARDQGGGSGAADLSSDMAPEPGWRSGHFQRFLREGPGPGRLPDFSRAGYRGGAAPIPEVHPRTFDAAAFGAVPDDGQDDTAALQAALDEAGRQGGGLVLLPPGRFDVHSRDGLPFLAIRASRVVLRGAGAGEGGTVLHLGARAPYDGKTSLPRPGATLSSDPRRFAAVAILGPDEAGAPLGRLTAPLLRGEDTARLDSTAALSPGQVVRVALSSAGVTGVPDLPTQLTAPLALTAEMFVTTSAPGQSVSYFTTVTEVLDGGRVRFDQAARLDLALPHGPRLESFPSVEGAGIERLRIESAWPGGYAHHKPFPWDATDKTALRTKAEQDYLWVGVWISQARDSWVRDVVIRDCTEGVRVAQGAYLSIERVRSEGLDGHHGVHLARSHGVLVRDYEARARLVHPVSMESWASGNVFLRARCSYAGTDEATSTGPHMDFHGLFPYENLYDGLRGCYVRPGGDREVLPHAGVRNTFWNLELPTDLSFRPELFGEGEFFRTPNFDLARPPLPASSHQHFPQSFLIGVHRAPRPGGDGAALPVTVAGSGADRVDEWLTVEGAGRPGVDPPSLYEAQLALRQARGGR